MTTHKQVGVWAYTHVDAGIAPILEALWARQVRTLASCEGIPGEREAYIMFSDDGLRVVEELLSHKKGYKIEDPNQGGNPSLVYRTRIVRWGA